MQLNAELSHMKRIPPYASVFGIVFLLKRPRDCVPVGIRAPKSSLANNGTRGRALLDKLVFDCVVNVRNPTGRGSEPVVHAHTLATGDSSAATANMGRTDCDAGYVRTARPGDSVGWSR